MPLLEGKGVTKYFGGLAALKDVDFEIEEGEIVGLIGPNGSGKTTLLNCISGVLVPTSGRIYFLGQDITGLKPHKICKLGMGRTFQIPRPFMNMTVLENTMVCTDGDRERALEAVRHVNLEEKINVLAKTLTFHERRRLEIARALAVNPKIILLDEVAAGLNPKEIVEFTGLIRKIRDELGITILWVEHVMKAIMTTAERIIVLNKGTKITEGTPKEVAENPEVIEAYLGEEYKID
ncbi:ABC transporter ATP-binding protein [Candidatus Bathyarchaeota archaeon]|nr:MAG: ABC transporter ATP-binding protein [Candidatus Bathyarchaeota archaeon]